METKTKTEIVKRINDDTVSLILTDHEFILLSELIESVFDLAGMRINDHQIEIHNALSSQIKSDKIKEYPDMVDDALGALKFMNEVILVLGQNFDFASRLYNSTNEFARKM